MPTDLDPIDVPDVTEADSPAAAEPSTSLATRPPLVPQSLADLAAMESRAFPVLKTRVDILATARKAAIALTYPTDWTKYKAEDGSVLCYLEDGGADRVRDVFGIAITAIHSVELLPGDSPDDFCYVVTGSGYCSLTGQAVHLMEGVRGSREKACEGLSGAMLKARVRKLARANLDGGITRELSGLKNVPEEEVQAVYASQGAGKTTERSHLGRGYGSQAARRGAEVGPNVPPPVCPHCQAVGVYYKATDSRAAFYGCPNYKQHQNKRWGQDAAAWLKDWQKKQPPTGPAAAPAPAAGPPAAGPMDASEIWPEGREPGQEG